MINENQNRIVTISRIFDSPLATVWEAWTQPQHIAKWWGPKGMPVEVKSHEFKVGGKWAYSMPMPDGGEFISEGTYLEIEEFKKIATTANFRPMTEGVELHISFEEHGDQTLFIFNVVHPDVAYRLKQEKMGIYTWFGVRLLIAWSNVLTTSTDNGTHASD